MKKKTTYHNTTCMNSTQLTIDIKNGYKLFDSLSKSSRTALNQSNKMKFYGFQLLRELYRLTLIPPFYCKYKIVTNDASLILEGGLFWDIFS